MRYQLTRQSKEANAYLQKLIGKNADCEIKEIRPRRSVSQNSYLHVCISLFGLEVGYTPEEAKTILKRECPFMVYEKEGNKFLKNTSRMDSKELTDFIEWIRNFSSTQGVYIPTSEEYLTNRYEIDNKINQLKKFF